MLDISYLLSGMRSICVYWNNQEIQLHSKQLTVTECGMLWPTHTQTHTHTRGESDGYRVGSWERWRCPGDLWRRTFVSIVGCRESPVWGLKMPPHTSVPTHSSHRGSPRGQRGHPPNSSLSHTHTQGACSDPVSLHTSQPVRCRFTPDTNLSLYESCRAAVLSCSHG